MYFSVSISESDRSFLAGFIEGEATLRICEHNGGQSYGCQITLNQRDDEQDLLEWILATTGLGRLRRVAARLTSKPQIIWIVDSQDDCRELLALIEPCGFHGRRAAELRVWSRAVHVWTESSGDARRSALRRLQGELRAARRFGGGARAATPFASRRQLLGYISGFTSAEGCFGLSDCRPRFSIHLRHDDRPLLDLLAGATGLGKVTDHRPAQPLNPSSTWTIAGRAQLAELRDLLRIGGLAGRKARELDVWSLAVDELNRGAMPGVVPRRDMLERMRDRLAEVRAYRAPERKELLRLSGRDTENESLAALVSWSRVTHGSLACGEYMRWRRDHPESPNRNTIVRHYGSWHGALEAAGLGDRAARAPRPAGGEARRQQERDAQRARVIAAVRRFKYEHGRLPRALEFFRWRYEASVDSPSQASVYKLFPGGWSEVLGCAARHAAGATV